MLSIVTLAKYRLRLAELRLDGPRMAQKESWIRFARGLFSLLPVVQRHLGVAPDPSKSHLLDAQT